MASVIHRRSPTAAAALSMLLPGLGQVVAGRRRRGFLWAGPVAALAVLALAAVASTRSASDWLAFVVRPQVLLGLLILNAGLLVYHLAAIADAWHIVRRENGVHPAGTGRGSIVALAILLLATLALHGAAGWLTYRAGQTVNAIFVATDPGGMTIPAPGFADSTPGASPSPAASSGGMAAPAAASPTPAATASPSPTPAPSESIAIATEAPASVAPASPSFTPSPPPTPEPSPSPTASAAPVPAWAADGRLNVLLVGSDAGPDRWSLRTDTMVVLSVDVASARAALFGIPRNLIGVPLAPEDTTTFANGRFPDLLNALYVYADGRPAQFPGGQSRGFRAVAGAVQELVGVRLDGMAVVNLAGFVRLVNAIGGLWINIPSRVVDDYYPLEDGTGHIAVAFNPGCQHLDGRMALAYARSRHQDSDYGRMRRQQQVLIAVRRQLDPIALLPKVPELLDAAGSTLWTTLDPNDLGGLAALLARVDTATVQTVTFVPPAYPEYLNDAEIEQIRDVVRTAFAVPPPPTPPSGSAPAPCP